MGPYTSNTRRPAAWRWAVLAGGLCGLAAPWALPAQTPPAASRAAHDPQAARELLAEARRQLAAGDLAQAQHTARLADTYAVDWDGAEQTPAEFLRELRARPDHQPRKPLVVNLHWNRPQPAPVEPLRPLRPAERPSAGPSTPAPTAAEFSPHAASADRSAASLPTAGWQPLPQSTAEPRAAEPRAAASSDFEAAWETPRRAAAPVASEPAEPPLWAFAPAAPPADHRPTDGSPFEAHAPSEPSPDVVANAADPDPADAAAVDRDAEANPDWDGKAAAAPSHETRIEHRGPATTPVRSVAESVAQQNATPTIVSGTNTETTTTSTTQTVAPWPLWVQVLATLAGVLLAVPLALVALLVWLRTSRGQAATLLRVELVGALPTTGRRSPRPYRVRRAAAAAPAPPSLRVTPAADEPPPEEAAVLQGLFERNLELRQQLTAARRAA